MSAYNVGDKVIVLDPQYGKSIGRVSGVYPTCIVIDGPKIDSRIEQYSIAHERVGQYVRPAYIPRPAQ